MSYPTQRYPPQQPPYPPQQPPYSPQQSPYPPQQPSYPPEQPLYPPEQPNAAVQVLPNHLGFQTTSLGGVPPPPFNNDVGSSEPPVVAPPRRKKSGMCCTVIIFGGFCLFLILCIALPLFVNSLMVDLSRLGTSAPREVGCIPKRDLTSGDDSLSSSSLTTFQCLLFCHSRGFRFASIHNGDHCSCTDLDLSTNEDFVGDSYCSTPCSGRAEELHCGGPQHESVFEVGHNLIVRLDEWQYYTVVPFYLNWNQSRAYCQSIGGRSTGGDLAVARMQDLTERSMTLSSLDEGHDLSEYWIGLTYSTSDGTWVWNNGETGGTHWETDIDGEPKKERCAAVRKSAGWRGVARQCDLVVLQGVCQFKVYDYKNFLENYKIM